MNIMNEEKGKYIQLVKSQYNTEGKKCYKAHAIKVYLTASKEKWHHILTGYVVDDLYFIDIEQKQIHPVSDFYLINNLEEEEGYEL